MILKQRDSLTLEFREFLHARSYSITLLLL